MAAWLLTNKQRASVQWSRLSLSAITAGDGLASEQNLRSMVSVDCQRKQSNEQLRATDSSL